MTPLPTVTETTSAPLTRPEMKPAVAAQNVTLQFAEDAGVYDLSFQVSPGTIFGLVGPSGCGKTTTVRLITGLYKPTQGEVTVLGETSSRLRAATRERIGYMPQQFVLYPQLSTWENINFVASLYGMPFFRRNKRLNGLLDFVELSPARNRLGAQLSGGMQRRLALAAALVNDPLILFADEPTAGVDPVLRSKFWAYFRSLRDQGRTLFVTTQYIGEAAYCDLVGVMRAGRLLYVDTPENLRRRAMGGEVIRLVVDAAQERPALRLLDAHEAVRQVQRTREPGHLLIYTDNAATTLPALVSLLNEQPGITVHSIDKYEPPFDDVFVQLMQEDTVNA